MHCRRTGGASVQGMGYPTRANDYGEEALAKGPLSTYTGSRRERLLDLIGASGDSSCT